MNTNEAQRALPNEPDIAYEEIEGEVVVIHFGSGAYFSMEGCGGDMWHLLCKAGSIGEFFEWTARAELGREVAETFLRQALKLQLVRLAEGGVGEARPDSIIERIRADRKPPLIHQHTDLHDLLMSDPIHDTPPEGWPARREGRIEEGGS